MFFINFDICLKNVPFPKLLEIGIIFHSNEIFKIKNKIFHTEFTPENKQLLFTAQLLSFNGYLQMTIHFLFVLGISIPEVQTDKQEKSPFLWTITC